MPSLLDSEDNPNAAARRPLREIFEKYRNRKILFVEPGGNWGDHLIYRGAEHLADAIGLTWRRADRVTFLRDGVGDAEILYVHGSGGFTHYTAGRAAEVLVKALSLPDVTIVQGPCTIGDPDALESVCAALPKMQAAHLTFLTREARSAEIARSVLPRSVTCQINEDTAFYLDEPALASMAGHMRRRLKLIAVREDRESLAVAASARFNETVVDPAMAATSFYHWLRIHMAARTIVTNRTHSAICGAILGIPVAMFAGAYHKNKSIWEFSLKPRGVTWVEDTSEIPRRPEIEPILAVLPFDRMRRSYKLTRFTQRVKGLPLA